MCLAWVVATLVTSKIELFIPRIMKQTRTISQSRSRTPSSTNISRVPNICSHDHETGTCRPTMCLTTTETFPLYRTHIQHERPDEFPADIRYRSNSFFIQDPVYHIHHICFGASVPIRLGLIVLVRYRMANPHLGPMLWLMNCLYNPC